MKVAVCDDEQEALDKITLLIEDYMTDRGLTIEYSTFKSYEEIHESLGQFDIFLVDYDMPGIDGFEFSKRIYDEFGESKAIIFITAYDDVVYKAYEVRAWRYIIKPIKKEILYEAFDSYLTANGTQKRIVIIQNGEKEVINVSDIDFIQADGKMSVFYMSDGRKLKCRETMDSLEKLLSDFGCYRIHRKNIVNLKKVTSYMNNYVVLQNGQSLDMSPRRYNGFKFAYLKTGE